MQLQNHILCKITIYPKYGAKTGLNKQCRLRSDATVSGQGPHCLPLIQQLTNIVHIYV